MLNKFFGCTAIAAAAFLAGSMPASAHDGHDNMCGGVNDSRDDMVRTGTGKQVLLGTSAPCPVEVVTVVETDVVDLPNDGMVYFALDEDVPDAESQAALDEIVAAVKGSSPESVTVMGHADLTGTSDYNMSLSERRAKTIADAMMAAGIPASAISTMGYGDSEPAVETEEGVAMRQNRRVVIEAETEVVKEVEAQ